jgi:hypothetical protein
VADKEKMKQLTGIARRILPPTFRRRAAFQSTSCSRCSSPVLTDARRRKRWATIGKVSGRMTMMAVETTVPFPSSRYRSRPEIRQP